MIPIHFQVLNSSFGRVLKNVEHWNTVWDILSFSSVFKLGKQLRRERASFFSRRNGQFGLGLYRYIIKKLDEKKIPYKLQMLSTPVTLEVKPQIYFKEFQPEDYQVKAIESLNKGIKRGIFEAPTGAGKTFYEASIIKKFGIPKTLIITPTQNIALQTVKSLEAFLGRDIGLLGIGERDLKRVSVCLYQTLNNIELSILNDNIDLILVDECHLALDAIAKILSQLDKVWYRFGLTGTVVPKYKHKEWFTVTSQLGEVISKTSEKQARKRVVSDVEAYMFYFYDTPEYSKYFDIYRQDVLRNERRCNTLLDMVQFGFKEKGKKNCLLLVDEFEQAQIIKELAEERFTDKKMHPVLAWSKEDNESIKQRFIDGKIPFCIATPVFSVGTDIPNIEHICLGSARKSRSNLRQKIGRGRRKIDGKDSLLITDIYDQIGLDDKFFAAYSASRKSFYKGKKWYKGTYKWIKNKWILEED